MAYIVAVKGQKEMWRFKTRGQAHSFMNRVVELGFEASIAKEHK